MNIELQPITAYKVHVPNYKWEWYVFGKKTDGGRTFSPMLVKMESTSLWFRIKTRFFLGSVWVKSP